MVKLKTTLSVNGVELLLDDDQSSLTVGKMDLYLNGGDPLSLSLQDMLDCDIKTEVDSVLAGDLSLGDLPSFDMDDESLGSHMWFSNNGLHNGNSNSSNSNFNLDFVGGDAAAMMVNPNSVMPLTLMTSQKTVVEATSTDPDVSSDVDSPESSPSTSPPAPSYIRAVSATSTAAVLPPRTPSSQAGQHRTVPTMIRIAAKPAQMTTTTFAPTIVTTSTKTVPIITSSAKFQKHLQHLTNGASINGGVSTIPRTIQIHPSQIHQQTVQTLPPQTKKQFHINNNKHYVEMDFDDRAYPKPAYSYSCLIAMALKNSKTGSLPVSDIYSFMCEHFPYFKTAPSGWKNSVRHNLSLNKCFEKIEKPSGNGSQRKGCLWAMNPAKIAKMDDEVQKWSRKDPMAIKKAMVYPENLEMLERGEMKMSSRSELEVTGNSDDTETSDDGEGDADADNDTDVDMDGDLDEGVAPNQEDDDDEEVDTEEEEEEEVSTTELTTFPADFIIDNIPDSFNESSLPAFDIEVADGIYEELDLNEAKKLNLVDLKRSAAESSIGASRGARRTHSDPDQQDGYDFGLDEDEPPTSRSRIQGNYIYKPVVSIDGSFTTTSTSRRKQPLLVRSSSASIIKVENR